jgi:integrase
MGTLTDVAIRKAQPGRLHDGQGLMLQVRPNGSRFWLLRTMRDGRRSELGLGAYPAVSLAQARMEAMALRAKLKAGTDIASERKRAKADAKAGRALAREADALTFAVVARMAHGAQQFKTEKLKAAWLFRLEAYAFPHLGDEPVHAVDGPMVLRALEPIWLAKPETARRVRQLVGAVLRFAHVKGWRGPAPALADFTKDALPKHGEPVHRPAVEYAEAPAIVARLRAETPSMGRRALLFTILTAARSGETRLATWGEIDMDRSLWTIPAGRMKMGRALAVPLSEPAMALLRDRLAERALTRADEPRADELVFPSSREGRPLSDMTLLKAQKLAAPGTVPHGWRSTFRDWAGETTTHEADVIEAALAHQIGTATTRSYQRGNLLAKRRVLMADWAAFVTPAPIEGEAGNVIALGARRRGAA